MVSLLQFTDVFSFLWALAAIDAEMKKDNEPVVPCRPVFESVKVLARTVSTEQPIRVDTAPPPNAGASVLTPPVEAVVIPDNASNSRSGSSVASHFPSVTVIHQRMKRYRLF